MGRWMRATLAVVMGLTVAAPTRAEEAAAEKPLGTWTHRAEGHRITLVIEADSLRCTCTADEGVSVSFEADYLVSKDGILLGIIRAKKTQVSDQQNEWEGAKKRLFGTRFHMEKNALVITDFECSNSDVDKVKGIIKGKYGRAEGKKAASTRLPVPQYTAVPVFPWAAERLKETFSPPPRAADYTAVKPPIKEGDLPPSCHQEPPDNTTVLRAMSPVARGVPHVYDVCRDDFQITTQLLVDKVEPPRFFPLVGPAQLHCCHWKCTVIYTETIESSYPFPFRRKGPRIEVIYLDKNSLHRCEEKPTTFGIWGCP